MLGLSSQEQHVEWRKTCNGGAVHPEPVQPGHRHRLLTTPESVAL